MVRPRVEEWCSRALAHDGRCPREGESLLSKLTVIIPTYGRQEFLLRQIVHWRNAAATIVIVDGSPQPLSSSIQNLISSLLHIEYLHRPDSIECRLNLAAKHIRTPYAVCSGDDDLLLRTGLRSAIDKLENDPTLVACIGQSLRFYPSIDGSRVTYGRGYPHWRFEARDADLASRLTSAMARYNAATSYAVLREPCWSNSWGAIRHWSSPYAAELQQAIVTYMSGQLSTVDDVYWMRSSENLPVSIEGKFDRQLSFSTWWNSPRFELERVKFIETVTEKAADASQLGNVEARQVVLAAVDSYLERVRLKARRSFRLDAVEGVRSAASEAVRWALGEKQLLNLRAILKVERLGDLGHLGRAKIASFLGSAELISELSDVEGLIAGFYDARAGGT